MKVTPEVVDRFRADVRELVRRVAGDAPEPVVAPEFIAALEELKVAEEELRSQNEELLAVRETLEEERRRYEELFEGAPMAYVVTDPAGIVRHANEAASRLLGVRQDFIEGKPLTVFIAEAARRPVRRFLHTGGEAPRDWFIQLRPRSGSIVHAGVSVAAIQDDKGEVTGLRWLIREVEADRADHPLDDTGSYLRTAAEMRALRRQLDAERAAREAAENASRAKSEFLAVLSHELRTPMQALVGYTDLLESGVHGPLSVVQQEDLRRMQRSEQHLLRIVNRVLDFLKLDSGVGGDFEPRSFAMPEVLRGIHTLIAPQLEAKSLVFISRYQDPPPIAYADPSHVQQIVLNLLANAVKFTPSGGSVTVETGAESGCVLVRVIDTGVGIPPDMLEAVFEPFVQLREPGVEEMKGTGLGLAISRRLAEGMGGQLTAASEPGQGSTFTLRLPATEA